MSPKIKCIVACDESSVIGNNDKLPWHLPEDLKYFAENTSGNTVFMGRKTFWSIPEKFRPLPRRKHVVVTRSNEEREKLFNQYPEIMVTEDPVKFIESVKLGKENIQGESLWVIGGGSIYKSTEKLWDEIYLTKVFGSHKGDTYFNADLSQFNLVSEKVSETGQCIFQVWQRK